MENFESCASMLLSKVSQSVACNYVVNERQEHSHEAKIREQVLEIEGKSEEISALERSLRRLTQPARPVLSTIYELITSPPIAPITHASQLVFVAILNSIRRKKRRKKC